MSGEETGILAVSLCSLHIPKDGLSGALVIIQQRQQPELCARSGLSFPSWVPVRLAALRKWCNQCPSSFRVMAAALLSLFCRAIVVTTGHPHQETAYETNDASREIGKGDENWFWFPFFLWAQELILPRIWCLLRLSLVEEGEPLMPYGLGFGWHARKTSHCNFFPLHILTPLGWMQFIDPESIWWHWFGT